jgi:hypothetical protein
LIDEPAIQQLVTAAAATESDHLQRRITQVLTVKAVQNQGQPFPTEASAVPPVADRLQLGTTITGSPYSLDQERLTEHLLAVGRSGAGKTTLFYNLMTQLSVPFWSFDLKQDYRHLIRDDATLLVVPWPELRFNPLQPPPGVPPRRWAQVFTEMFGHATALLSGSKNYLLKQVIELYRLYDLFEEVTPPYPSLHELQRLLAADKINYVRKTANYRDTVLNRLEAMNLTAGTVFACSEGYPLDDLLSRNVVFEFDGLGTDIQNFLMETLVAAVYEYRLAQNHRGGGLRHVVFLDEGKRVFSAYKERQDAAGIPAIDQLTAKMREFGESLVVADQEATKLTDSLKANTATKVLLATGDDRQFRDITATMQLSDRQAAVAQHLTVGDAIVHTSGGEPCPVQLDNYELDKRVSDTELRRAQAQTWTALTATPRDTPQAFTQHPDLSDRDETADIPDDPPRDLDLSGAAEQLLTDVVEHPFTPLSERYDRFSSAYKGNKAKNTLVETGLVTEQPVTAGPAKRKLLELTERGRGYVEDELETDPAQSGRGGIVHRYWQHRLKDQFEAAGWPAKLEVFDADVYVNMDDAELVAEVAMGDNAREIAHVDEHLDTFDAVWVVCRNTAVRDGLQERLEENDLLCDRVVFRLFRELSDAENDAL